MPESQAKVIFGSSIQSPITNSKMKEVYADDHVAFAVDNKENHIHNHLVVIRRWKRPNVA